MSARRGFTLIELMAAVAIVLILAAILLSALGPWRGRARKTAARALLVNCGIALRTLREDYQIPGLLGANPDGSRCEEFFNTNQFARELAPRNPAWAALFTPRLNTRQNMYLDCRAQEIGGSALVDGWGSPLRYYVFAESSQNWPYLVECVYSAGPDRQLLTEDDVVIRLESLPAPADPADSATPASTVGQLQAIWAARPAAWRE